MFEKRIDRGVEYLDKNYLNWVNKIDLEILNMRFADLCIMGQLDQDSYETFNIYLGFSLPCCPRWGENENRWNILNREWTERIKLLQNT